MKLFTRPEPLEARIAPATTATVFGGVATFIGDGAADTLTISLDAASGFLMHDRFAAGDAGYASAFDFNSFTPGEQKLKAGAGAAVNYTDPGLNDTFVIDASAVTGPGTITVETGHVVAISGTQFRFDDSMKAAKVIGGSGDDVFTIRSTGNVTTGVTVDGGMGNDTFRISNTAGTIDDLAKPLTIIGGAGTDALIIIDNGNVNTGSTYALTATQTTRTTGGSGPAAILHGSGDIESYKLVTSQQDDFVTIDQGLTLSSGVAAISVLTNGGNDTLSVKPNPTSTIAIDGGDPTDPLEGDLLIVEQAGVVNLKIVTTGTPISGVITGDNIGKVSFTNVGTPAITGASPDKHSYTWLDKDGDLATLKVSSGTLSDQDFTFDSAGPLKQLQLVNFADDGTEFSGANVKIVSRTTALGGDGIVNVGQLDATGVVLGNVNIPGDLGSIDAGGLGVLKVHSLGKLGTATQGMGGTTISTVGGDVLRVAVKTDLVGSLAIAGNVTQLALGHNLVGTLATGGLTTGIIGGTVSGTLSTSANLGTLTIGGDVTGHINASSSTSYIGAITIAGSIRGSNAGISSAGAIGSVTVAGDVSGGASPAFIVAANSAAAGQPFGTAAIGSVLIAGSVEHAEILAGFDSSLLPVDADVQIGRIKIGGDLLASDIVAGIASGMDGKFGTADDSLIAGGSGAIASRIAKVVVSGQALGDPLVLGDSFAIEAQQLGGVRIGPRLLSFAATGLQSYPLGTFGDLIAREF